MPSPHRLRLTWRLAGASAGLLALALIRLAWLAGTDTGYEAGYRSAIQDAYAEGYLVPDGPEPVVLDF